MSVSTSIVNATNTIATSINSYLPLATNAVLSVEQTMASAPSQSKLTTALGIIMDGAKVGEAIPIPGVAAISSLVDLVDSIVSAFNASGLFSHPTGTPPITPTVTPLAAPVPVSTTAAAPATTAAPVATPAAVTSPVAAAAQPVAHTASPATAAAATTVKEPSILEQIFHPNQAKAAWAEHQAAPVVSAAPTVPETA